MNPLPEVQGSRCTRYRFRYSECRKCVDACPHDAIRLSDEGAAVEGDRCQGCGLCVPACPTETFGLRSLAPMPLVEAAKGREAIAIACQPSGVSADIKVPCLGGLGAALVAYLAQQGTNVSLCGSEHCAQCAHGKKGGDRFDLVLEGAAALQGASSRPSATVRRIEGAASLRAARPGAGAARRAFFRRLAKPSGQRADAAEHAAVPLRAIRAARPVACAQRDLLQLLGLDQLLPTHPAIHSAEVRLQPGCTGCEACARACPTGALQVRETATRWALLFERRNCVGCAVCVESCQPGVMGLETELPAPGAEDAPALALLVRSKQRCQRCDRSFVSSEPAAMCPVCLGDDQDFDRIFG